MNPNVEDDVKPIDYGAVEDHLGLAAAVERLLLAAEKADANGAHGVSKALIERAASLLGVNGD